MIVHLVLFKPRTGLSAAQREALASALETALRDVPSVRAARVGRRVVHGRPYEQSMHVDYEYAALIEFDDVDGLRAYLDHPAHETLAARFFESFQDALMYDYHLEEGAGSVRKLL